MVRRREEKTRRRKTTGGDKGRRVMDTGKDLLS